MSANESFNIWWRYITKKELSANMYRDRKVCFISILTVITSDNSFRVDCAAKSHTVIRVPISQKHVLDEMADKQKSSSE